MAEELKETAVTREIRRLREEDAERRRLAAAGIVTDNPAVNQPGSPVDLRPPQAVAPETPGDHDPALLAAIQAIAAGDNPIKTARLLSAMLAGGMKVDALAAKIHKSVAWLYRRTGLLKAAKDIQRLIEAGELTESEYYNNRQNVKAGIKGQGAAVRYQRMPTVTIGIEAARALAAILQELAAQRGAAPIRLDAGTSKKDLTGILNQRAGEIRGMLKE